MSKETREHLSSLMDGELSSEAGRFLARRLGADTELNATWQRYHLVRDCLRRPGQSLTYTQLSVDLDAVDSVSEDVEAQSEGVSPRRKASPSWLRPLAGSAIAASVAVAAVLVAVNIEAPSELPATEPFASPNTVVRRPTQLSLSQPVSHQQTMNRYLQRHSQVAGAVGQKGFVSSLPIMVIVPEQVVEAEDSAEESLAVPAPEGARRTEQP